MQTETKTCQNCKKDFSIEPEDFAFYQKIKVPAPTFCHVCRAQRRFAFRNDRNLFKVKDHFTGKDIFSLYPAEAHRPVVTQEEWNSDAWDAMDEGRDYDFLKPFFVQFFELERKIPIYNLNVQFMVESDYSGNATALKNCYLIFNSNNSEDCLYGNAVDRSKDCIDNSYLVKGEQCYESLWIESSYRTFFSSECTESSDIWFSKNCVGCNHCIGCVNVRNGSYMIFNEKYSKEEYDEKKKMFGLNTYSGIQKLYAESRNFWKQFPNKYFQGVKNVNSTGTYVTNSKNVTDSYFVREGENVRYAQYQQVPTTKDSYDVCIWGESVELCYETSICGDHAYGLRFCVDCWPNNRDCEYSFYLKYCSNCFGCVGLKNKEYCIFNRQYTKDEYETLKEKIIKHMDEMPFTDSKNNIYTYGEFFPIDFSTFGYNNTLAQEHMPLTKEDAVSSGYAWIEVDKGTHTITRVPSDIPDAIEDVGDSITREVLGCVSCGAAYRIVPAEFQFYKKLELPIPHLCYNCRHSRRISEKLKMPMYESVCMCGGEESIDKRYVNTTKHDHDTVPCSRVFETSYNPNDNSLVYCASCYQQEVM